MARGLLRGQHHPPRTSTSKFDVDLFHFWMSLFYMGLFWISSLFSYMQSFRITPMRVPPVVSMYPSLPCHHSTQQHSWDFCPWTLYSPHISHGIHSFMIVWKHFYISGVFQVNHTITSWAYHWSYTLTYFSQTRLASKLWDAFPSQPAERDVAP